jgi:arylsulfatase A-like enzyme
MLALIAGSAHGKAPNILIILADDLGYADVGIHGCKDIPTPNIDALAARGVRCSNGYSSHPYCSPMRAGLMACRYQHRFGYVNNVAFDPQNPRIGIPVSEKTIASRLRDAGYETGMAGKWHLGASHAHHPNRRGFDFFYGFLGGGHDYFEVDSRKPMHEGYQYPLDHNGRAENLDAYLTDVLTDQAVGFIERSSRAPDDQPFFFYLAYNAPHGPLQAPAEDLAKFASIEDKRRRTYAAMVHAMDRGIGKVIASLDANGLREDTIVFFLSDNGGPSSANASSNAPLRGDKGDVFEGGVRVPFVVSWPGKLPEGKVYDQPVISIDISRTALELAGAKIVPKLEGVNLSPFLSGARSDPPHEALFWWSGDKWAVRSGEWKLLREKGMVEPQLFQLSNDIAEEDDRASSDPDRTASLRSRYEAWSEGNDQSLFPGYREYHKEKKQFYQELE